jgi:hypothetical protein
VQKTQEEELDNADKSKYCFHGLGAKWLKPEKVKNWAIGHSSNGAAYTAENTSFKQILRLYYNYIFYIYIYKTSMLYNLSY